MWTITRIEEDAIRLWQPPRSAQFFTSWKAGQLVVNNCKLITSLRLPLDH